MKTYILENTYGWSETVEAENLEAAKVAEITRYKNFYSDGKTLKRVTETSVTAQDVKIGDRILAKWTARGQSRGTVEKIGKTKFTVSGSSHGNCTSLNIAGFIGIVVFEA